MGGGSVGRAESAGESERPGDKTDSGAELRQRNLQVVKEPENRRRAGFWEATCGHVRVAAGGRDSRFRSTGL